MRETLQQWGEALAERRKAIGMSQKDLAVAAKTTQQHLSLIERGAVSPRDDLRLRLAGVLGVSVEELFPYPAAVPA